MVVNITCHNKRYKILKPSIKTITVKTLLTVILIAALIMTAIIGFGFRSLSNRIVRNQALATSELVKAGLTSHMKAGIMDKRDYFLEEIKTVHNIEKIKIIRSAEVNRQFGEGNGLEQLVDANSQKVFESKKPLFIIDEYSRTAHIRALVPYVASTEGRLNCLGCHQVPEGTALGVVDIQMDVTEYRNFAFAIIFIIALTSIFLVVLIIVNTFRTIETYVKEPLETLIDKADEAYHTNQPLDELKFESLEFQNVAKEINLFNSDLKRTHRILEEKNLELIALNDEIEDTLRETVFTMGVIEEQRSKETKNHTKRVTQYCMLIAGKLGLSDDEIMLIGDAAPLHDIGKIGISDYILLKSDKLTKAEFELMKSHTKIGHEMLVHSNREILKAAAIIAAQHHERWDGTGYPEGLKTDNIHIFARITALADVFDALSTKRTYKEAWKMQDVINEIVSQRGRHFDPALVDIFLKNTSDFLTIHDKYGAR